MTVSLGTSSAAELPSTPSPISIPELIAHGKPFVEFPKFSIIDLRRETSLGGAEGSSGPPTSSNQDANPNCTGFAEWLSRKLQTGQPFVIQGLEKLPEWDKDLFSVEGLIELSTKKNIPIRNCSTSRDLSFTLKKFTDAARQSYREFRNFYARDLHCPPAWLEQCSKLLPPELQYSGRADLFQWLPPCARSEVMMAYVGSEGSSSGFHRCFSSTVALNLLVETNDRPVVCFGTDFESQTKYDAFMAARGASPHVDWLNLEPDELRKADFPIYVCEQNVGDLVVFPPATAHQVWNIGTLSTKMVWNILHPLSLEAGLDYVQPPFNRLCHPDVARTNLSLACAMLSLLREDSPALPPDLPLLTRLFRQMVQDESIEDEPAMLVTLVQIPESVIATCDFCGTAIWNRHVRCTECTDFDLCLLCFLSGRSCEHVSSYAWAEIVPQKTCEKVLDRAGNILGRSVDGIRAPERRKSLGTAVNDLMKARQSTSTRLCHLCRIDHLEWKGRRCDTCTAFFCFRGLYRHFDMYAADVIRHSGLWMCPKCLETCNCRCCHFPSAYVKAEKPASKRRVKPADPRGKVMGFTDNVFDQKKRNASGPSSSSTYPIPSAQESRGQKRPLSVSEIPVSTASRSIPSHYNPSSATRYSPSSEPEILTRSMNEKGHISADLSSDSAALHTALHLRPPNRDENSSQGASDGFLARSIHGIGYVTQSPLPPDQHLSLPPLKSHHFMPGSGSRSTPITTIPCSSVGMTTLATAAGSRGKIPMPGQREETLRSQQTYHVDPGRASSVLPMHRSRLPYLDTPDSLNRNARLHPSSLSQTNSNVSQADPAASATQQSMDSTTTNGHSSNEAATSSPSRPSASISPTDPRQDPLATLEAKLLRLRHYGDELQSLGFHDSHKLLQKEIQSLEETLILMKKERSEKLLHSLESEFPGLIGVRDGIKQEGSRLGYL